MFTLSIYHFLFHSVLPMFSDCHFTLMMFFKVMGQPQLSTSKANPVFIFLWILRTQHSHLISWTSQWQPNRWALFLPGSHEESLLFLTYKPVLGLMDLSSQSVFHHAASYFTWDDSHQGKTIRLIHLALTFNYNQLHNQLLYLTRLYLMWKIYLLLNPFLRWPGIFIKTMPC